MARQDTMDYAETESSAMTPNFLQQARALHNLAVIQNSKINIISNVISFLVVKTRNHQDTYQDGDNAKAQEHKLHDKKERFLSSCL